MVIPVRMQQTRTRAGQRESDKGLFRQERTTRWNWALYVDEAGRGASIRGRLIPDERDDARRAMACLFGNRGNARFCFYDHTSEVVEPLIDPRLDCFRVGIHEHLDLHFVLHGGEFPSLCSATIAAASSGAPAAMLHVHCRILFLVRDLRL